MNPKEPLTSAEHLQSGLAKHQAGNLAAAAHHYCKTLETAPSNADAFHLLGLVLSENGEHGRALMMLSRAVELRPNAVFLANLGLACRRAGDLDVAISAYREALRLNPYHAPTLGKLGRALIETGDPTEAEQVLTQASLLDASNPELWNALGHARAAQQRYAEARGNFAQALSIDPTYTEARENLAHALLRLGHAEAANGLWQKAAALYAEGCELNPRLDSLWYSSGLASMALSRPEEASRFYQRALALNPEFAEAHNNLGHVQQAAGNVPAALSSYERALSIRPGYVEARYNLALTLQNANRIPEAEAQYESLLSEEPTHADSLNNMAGIHLSQNRIAEARQKLELALTHAPTHLDARWNLALAHLAAGDWARGWPLYEARLEQPTFPQRKFNCLRWRGEPLSGQSIYVWAEQGLGDTIQFMRYLPLLVEAGARVVFEVQERLQPFLSALLAVGKTGIEVRARGDEPAATGYHAPLLSLPGCFETIPPVWLPAAVTPAALGQGTGSKIGLCWAGHPHHVKGRHRSIPLAALTSFAELRDLTFVSLQRGPQEAELDSITGPWRPVKWEAENGGITELASLIAGLDLIVTVDTMIAHLAGTLGKPVWTMLPFAADWRWMLDREDSIWYPTMRLFRQCKAGDWAPVVDRVKAQIESRG